MDFDENETPQKHKKFLMNNMNSTAFGGASNAGYTTPQAKTRTESMIFHSSQHSRMTPSDKRMLQETSQVHILTTTMVSTPPAKRIQQKIRNPFEAALAERLHLPLIGSPSLFQRPTTPQLSSTQFEWTIDEVSSLQPAHVEAHETQFQDSPDPEYEAKAQLAISSYFKEQQIVPSPVDCPLRNNRIILSELNANTPISKPGRRIKDCATQTELTLPFNLPKELEEALKPYFQPHLAGVGKEFRGLGYRPRSSGSENIQDVSLRRKLFDMKNVVILDDKSQSPSTSKNFNRISECFDYEKGSKLLRTPINGKLSESSDKSIWNSLSPITDDDGLSFSSQSSSPTRRKNRLRDFGEELSPILPSPQKRRSKIQDGEMRGNNENSGEILNNSNDPNLSGRKLEFSFDRSSSPLKPIDQNALNNIGNYSSDSFNIKVSRLTVNSAKSLYCKSLVKSHKENLEDGELFLPDDTNEILDDDDDMQVSQLSMQSSNCSSSNSDTPKKPKRSASRKNLSHSFSASWLPGDDELPKINAFPNILVTKTEDFLNHKKNNGTEGITDEKLEENQKINFYRTDSGFNEMTSSSSGTSQEELSRETGPLPASRAAFQDISMAHFKAN